MIAPIVSIDDVPPNALLVDVRWYLDGRDGQAAFTAGHLPGSRFLDLDTVLAGPPGGPAGRHPLPSPEVFADGLGAAGIGEGDLVVAYDDANAMAASRLVWMLRVLGRPAAVLDGGLAGWSGVLETGWPAITPVGRRAQRWPDGVTVDADELVTAIADGAVVADSRAAARYAGEAHPLDTRRGHVPGAVSLPFDGNLVGSGRFAERDALRERFAAAGVTAESVFYCGSGVSACVNLLAAEHAGLGLPRLYVGSWSGWTADPDRPLATGATT